jgi:uncharacterized protein (TIGR02646 family)
MAPDTLKSKEVAAAQQKIRTIAEKGKPASKDFPSHWGKDDVRTVLWEMQHQKCCYCERMRDKNRESDIEHFRPKADVTEADGVHKGYWWLAYEWTNLFFSCRYCNQEHKKNHFPLAKGKKHAAGPDDPLAAEGALLIDPTEQDPETLIGYDWVVENGNYLVHALPRKDTVEGRKTIKVLGLNRKGLPEERGSLIGTLEALAMKMKFGLLYGNQAIVDEAAQQILEETSAKRPFAGFRRDFFRKQFLEKYISHN